MIGPADDIVTGSIPTEDNNTEYSKIEILNTNTLMVNGHYDGIILTNISIKDSNDGIYI